jgi:hypothetical protein
MNVRQYLRNPASLKRAIWMVVVCLWLAAPLRADAVGREVPLRGEDLDINVDSRWAGCSHGGYYPIRIRVTNLKTDREIEFRFEPFGNEGLPSVSRTVALKPNASMQFSLSIPMISTASGGFLNVYENGKQLKSLNTQITLPEADSAPYDRPSMLVISAKGVDVDQFEYAVNSLSHAAPTRGGYGYGGAARTSDHEVVPPLMLPDRWIDYSGLDFVAISLDDLERIPTATRQAMLGWVRTGGNLLVIDVKSIASESEKLNRLLELDRQAFEAGERWNSPNLGTRTPVQIIEAMEYPGGGYGVSASGGVVISGETPAATTVQNPEYEWANGAQAFQSRGYLLGSVTAFQENPFPGTPHEWAWLLKELGSEQFQWTTRHGVSPRHGNKEFLHFLIAGISGVPVVAFLVLITIFSIVIGPMNYFFLTKRKRLYLLVITIPAIALLTSVSLFGYSVVAHGFGTKSRIRSLTVVDQGSQTAVDCTRVSLYAGLAPSEGLQFSATTAVYPIWPDHDEQPFSSGNVDWTNQQSLEVGFLKSRTRTQFYNVTQRDERGRLQFGPPVRGSLKVDNGFETGLEQLLVRGTDGKLYYGRNIAAGSSATLKEATREVYSEITKVVRENQPGLPEKMSEYNDSPRGFGYGFRQREEVYTQFSKNQMERLMTGTATSTESQLGKQSYFGFFAGNPGVEIGVENTSERDGLHALYGYY